MSVNKIHLYCILGAFVQISEINLIILDKKKLCLGSMVEKNSPIHCRRPFSNARHLLFNSLKN